MRYYKIVITNPKNNQIVRPRSIQSLGVTDATYTSYANGKNLRGALNVEFDLFTSSYNDSAGASWCRIWGISLEEINQSHDLNNFNIAIYGGMQAGLPLANPKQNGLLVSGWIFQSFGNWIGLDQTLEFIIQAGEAPTPAVNGGTGTLADPKNITHHWIKGNRLAEAIRSTLATAFPDYTSDIHISEDLVYTEDDTGYYQTVEQYAQYVQRVSESIIGGPNYNGVRIFLQGKTFYVFDGTVNKLPLPIDFKDMIGQPTWIGPGTMQVKFAMRADIKVGDFIKMPDALVTTTSAAVSSQVDLQSAFKGTFQVAIVRHSGNFRQSDASSWVTIVDANPVNPQLVSNSQFN